MSKDFEKEYRELTKNETPDLWNRIEAGLHEKNVPVQETAQKKNNNIINIVLRFAPMAAAVVLVALLIPVFTRMTGNSAKDGRIAEPDTSFYNDAAEEAEYVNDMDMNMIPQAESTDSVTGGDFAWEKAEADGSPNEVVFLGIRAEEQIDETLWKCVVTDTEEDEEKVIYVKDSEHKLLQNMIYEVELVMSTEVYQGENVYTIVIH